MTNTKSKRGQNQKQSKTNNFENELGTGRTVLIFNSNITETTPRGLQATAALAKKKDNGETKE